MLDPTATCSVANQTDLNNPVYFKSACRTRFKSLLIWSSFFVLSLVFVACQPAQSPLGQTPKPVVSPGSGPQARPLENPNQPRSLRIKFIVDSALQPGFKTKAQSLAECRTELSNVRTTLVFQNAISAQRILDLRAQGFTVTVADGKTTISFPNTLITSGTGDTELDLAYTFQEMPTGIAQGTTTFKNALQEELGFIRYTANVTAQGSTTILVELRANGGDSELVHCPELTAKLTGGILTQTGGDVVAYVPPSASPSGSSSSSASPSASLPPVPTGPTPVPLPTPSPATISPQVFTLSANTGAPLDTIIITGTGLMGTQSVKFGNVNAYDFKVDSEVQITAVVPRGFTSGVVTVSHNFGTASSTEVFTLNETIYSSPRTVYVKSGGTGDGSSWANAMGNVNHAMYMANSGDQVWIAEGIYIPTTDGDRRKAFKLRTGVSVYGGFAGTENSLAERVINSHVTILSGDLAGNDNYLDQVYTDLAENSVHVVIGAQNTTLDGLTIQGGNANSFFPNDRGAGVYIENALVNLNQVRIIENRSFGPGGGLFNGTSGSPIMTNVSFNSNVSGQGGGGMYSVQGSLPSLNTVTFAYNEAKQGGGMYNEGISPVLTNVSFLSNTATYFGGGMYNRRQASPIINSGVFDKNKAASGGAMYNVDGASPEISVVGFTENEADNGAGIYNYNESSPSLTDCQFLGNTAVYVGGAMYNYKHIGLAPTLNRVVFVGNKAANGGAIANRSGSSPKIINTVFTANQATAAGGAIYNYNRGNPRILHGTFSNNLAPSGAEIYAGAYSNPAITSTVIWNETLDSVVLIQSKSTFSASSSSVKNLGQVEHAGFGNLDINPFFVNSLDPAGPDEIYMTADDGLRLSSTSPALNYGLTAGAPLTDILGVTREVPPEQGAYEGSFAHVDQPLSIEDLVVGTGENADNGDTITVNYIGTLIDGREFDNSYTRGVPYTFVLGANTTIAGWEQGLVDMKVGGKRKLIVPPHLAYGNNSVGIIPPNATLIFEIELISVTNP